MNLVNLIWRNSIRKKTRFALTVLSVVIAFFLFTSFAGIKHALNASVSDSNQFRLMTSHKISITRSLPINYKQKIRQLEGIDTVSYASWFGGYFQNEKNQITVLAVDSENYFDVHQQYNLSAAQLGNWKKNRTGLVIGKKLADKFGWKLGDKIPLGSSIWMNKDGLFTWEFIVEAIFTGESATVNEQQMFFQHKYFDKARAYGRHSASWLIPVVKPNANKNKVIKSIDNLFENANEATRTTTEQVFIKEQTQQFVDMAMILKLVITAVFFTLLLIVCNTMMQVNRERRSETAMMKALGFSTSFLAGVIYFESLLLFSLGALLGTSFSLLSLTKVQALFADFLPGIAISSNHYFDVVALAVAGAFICSFIPVISIKQNKISTNLGAR